MFCIKCGAELADSEKFCPLCETPVYNPYIKQSTAEGMYPEYEQSDKFNRSGIMFIVSVLFGLAVLLTLLCDMSINGKMAWSGYAVNSLLLAYIIIILPIWFIKANPVIFVPVDFAACALFLWYMEYATGGKWFLTFALPLVAAMCIIVTAVVTLRRYIDRGRAFVFGGASIALGLYSVLTEILMIVTFSLPKKLIWSYYPLVAMTVIGLMLIVIGICKPIRESLKKKFFI